MKKNNIEKERYSENSVLRCAEKFFSGRLVRKLARLTGLNIIGKKVYFKFFVPRGLEVCHNMGGVEARFFVKNYSQLIYLTRTVVGAGDERRVINILLDNIKPGDVIYDIGAFLGFHSVFFAKKAGEQGRVAAFEPSPFNYQSLLGNLKLNGLNNVDSFNIALGDEEKEVSLLGRDPSMYRLGGKLEGLNTDSKVKVMPGDSLVGQGKIPPPSIVKIDVEGYEYNVILGLRETLKQGSCRLVCCEVHPDLLPKGVTAQMVIDLMKDLGFGDIQTFGRGDTFHILCRKQF